MGSCYSCAQNLQWFLTSLSEIQSTWNGSQAPLASSAPCPAAPRSLSAVATHSFAIS